MPTPDPPDPAARADVPESDAAALRRAAAYFRSASTQFQGDQLTEMLARFDEAVRAYTDPDTHDAARAAAAARVSDALRAFQADMRELHHHTLQAASLLAPGVARGDAPADAPAKTPADAPTPAPANAPPGVRRDNPGPHGAG